MACLARRTPPDWDPCTSRAVATGVDRMLLEGHRHPTEFELTTAAALVHFAAVQPDIVVVEVGVWPVPWGTAAHSGAAGGGGGNPWVPRRKPPLNPPVGFTDIGPWHDDWWRRCRVHGL